MINSSDFLQADDINKVILVVKAVHAGNHTDDQIESYIGVNSAGRQGRYYRLAAEKLGFVELQPQRDNHTVLTPKGQQFIARPNQQKNDLISAIRSLPVFSSALAHITRCNQKGEPINIKTWFINSYPGEESTAERRYSTFIKYLEYCGITYQ